MTSFGSLLLGQILWGHENTMYEDCSTQVIPPRWLVCVLKHLHLVRALYIEEPYSLRFDRGTTLGHFRKSVQTLV